MNRHALFASVLILAGLGGMTRADGLLFRLPEDKHWVKFDLDVQLEGQANPFPGSVTMKSVGFTFEDGEKCRWIEMELKVKPGDGPEQLSTFKMLLPETHLKAGANPLEKIVRAWSKTNEEAATQFTDCSRPELAAVAIFFTGPATDAKELDKQFEDSKLGNLECAGVRGTHVSTMGPAKFKTTGEIRRHDKAPFGVVRAEYQFEVLNDKDETQAKGSVRLKLADFGTDAMSNLPDSQ